MELLAQDTAQHSCDLVTLTIQRLIVLFGNVSPLCLCLKSLSLSQVSVSPPPIPRVAEIAVDRALRHLGDHRQAALVLRGHDAARDLINECFGNPLSAQLLA